MSTQNGTYGSFTILADGNWTYTLNQTLADGLSSGQTFQETFTAYVKDNNGAVVAQTVTVTVSGSDESYIGDGTDNTISVRAMTTSWPVSGATKPLRAILDLTRSTAAKAPTY